MAMAKELRLGALKPGPTASAMTLEARPATATYGCHRAQIPRLKTASNIILLG